MCESARFKEMKWSPKLFCVQIGRNSKWEGNCEKKERTKNSLRTVSKSWSLGWRVLRRAGATLTFS